MATLDPPFGGLKTGTHALQIGMLGWHDVGSCNITRNDDYHFAAKGSYDVFGKSGTFDFTMTLTDQNPAATSGPCTVTNAGQTLQGTYTRVGSAITFTDGRHSITALPDAASVILEVAGYPKARIVA
ncbi:MAG: hypothetical protein JO030_00845 [Candidatus Eremiobacteraeota bacterium]|nr:hypothetical protein [Candidatus Eremiobacteraeota bacterium]